MHHTMLYKNSKRTTTRMLSIPGKAGHSATNNQRDKRNAEDVVW